jgi:2',3'-cyclic-nucleotide 2'-phosphodiesterase (5'-nucleotidase family)
LKKARLVVFLCSILLLSAGALRLSGNPRQADDTSKKNGDVSIVLLDTTDTHGRIEPWDYYQNKPVNQGLAKVATLIKEQRAEAPDALLLDCGDTIQGTPMAYYFAEKDTSKPNPMIAAFNLLHYDAMEVGNHEFNFGEEEMWKAKSESHFPWLAANIKQTYAPGTTPYFQPYIIKTIKGVRIGIVGFVTPGIPRWEIPEHYRGYEFEPVVQAAKRVIPEVRKQVDLLVVIMHSGFAKDPVSGEVWPEQGVGENVAPDLTEVPGIDIIFYGHTHSELSEKILNGVLMAQPKNWGMALARADVDMRQENGHWEVVSKHSRTIPVTAQVEPDPEMMKLAEPYHQETEKYLNTPIAHSSVELSGKYARYQDSPLLDVIQKAEMEAGHADVSMATMLYAGAHIPSGPVTVGEAAALYIYENTLYVVQMTGAQLKDALEHAEGFFSQWPLARGETPKLPSYNADQAYGVTYEVDLTKPVGQRIVNLQFHGKPVDPAQVLRVATNNYRYTGGGGYSAFKGLPVVFTSSDEIRQIVIDYLTRTKEIPTEAVGNWKMEPREAVVAIEQASDANTGAQSK